MGNVFACYHLRCLLPTRFTRPIVVLAYHEKILERRKNGGKGGWEDIGEWRTIKMYNIYFKKARSNVAEAVKQWSAFRAGAGGGGSGKTKR